MVLIWNVLEYPVLHPTAPHSNMVETQQTLFGSKQRDHNCSLQRQDRTSNENGTRAYMEPALRFILQHTANSSIAIIFGTRSVTPTSQMDISEKLGLERNGRF
jgi:hypothetical protein